MGEVLAKLFSAALTCPKCGNRLTGRALLGIVVGLVLGGGVLKMAGCGYWKVEHLSNERQPWSIGAAGETYKPSTDSKLAGSKPETKAPVVNAPEEK